MLAVAMTLGVSGCGVTYNSPSVRPNDEQVPVTVVPITRETVSRANQSPYTPRGLPGAFYETVGTGSGIVGSGALPQPPELPDVRREPLELRPLPDVGEQPYRIGVGDIVLLSTRAGASTVEQLTGLLAAESSRRGYTVRDDGVIAIPEIGTIDLAGRTLEEAEDAIFDALIESQLDPSFSLEVAEFNSQRVAVGGAVGAPALLPITLQPLTLRDALTTVGGIAEIDQEFASIRIYRDGTLYQIPVQTYRERPALGEALLVAGDAVFVDTTYDLDRALRFYEQRLGVISQRDGVRSAALGRLNAEIGLRRGALEEKRSLFQSRLDLDSEPRDYVYLAGELSQGRFPLPFGMKATLADVLFEQGGFQTATGNPSQIYVLRDGRLSGRAGSVVAYQLDAANVSRLMYATEFEMRPRDIIFVEEQPITKWNRAFQQFFPLVTSSVTGALQ